MIIQMPISKDGRKILLDFDSRVFNPSVASTTLLYAIDDEDLVGKRVFDVGVGTGYLGLGALLRGANFMYGIDINPKAVRLAQCNAKTNGLEQKCNMVVLDMMKSQLKIDVDIIVSNPPLMPSVLERDAYGPDNSTNAGDGSRYAIRVLEMGEELGNPRIVVYLPVFNFSNPQEIIEYGRSHYHKVEIVSQHDIVFDWRKLAQMDIFEQIYLKNKCYPVEHEGHPYWRIEVLRCQGVKNARS